MLKIEKKVLLSSLTTLNIGSEAEYFARLASKEDLISALSWAKDQAKKIYILGGGANTLVSGKVRGLVLKNEIKGKRVVSVSDNEILVEAKSGEDWTKFVSYTVRNGWHGLENLSLIYGTVGAAPIQNIGAYGVELKDVFDHLVAIDLKTGAEKKFSLDDCRFGYRDSIFKKKFKGKYFIYSVTVRLQKKASLKLEYGSIKEVLASRGITKPNLKDVAAAVKAIRRSKLPNPDKLPNAGSFFKNIEVSLAKYSSLKRRYPDIPGWPVNKKSIKIPSAWLIEATGFKGKKIGSVGMHERQALVMVNYGGAKPAQALALSQKIKRAVKERFGLDLEEEINII